MGHLIFIIIVIVIKALINIKPDPKYVDDCDTGLTKSKKKPIVYISDGIELEKSFRKYYFEVLDMRDSNSYDRDLIFEQSQKQYSFYQEDIKIGYKTRYSKKEIQLAESYILEYFDYVVNIN